MLLGLLLKSPPEINMASGQVSWTEDMYADISAKAHKNWGSLPEVGRQTDIRNTSGKLPKVILILDIWGEED